MTSIERTAHPRFKPLISAHELHLFYAPSREEAAWAAEQTDSDGHLLALLLALKSYQRTRREGNRRAPAGYLARKTTS
ncbi:hypothetical protein [Streptomyces sp. NPDC001275]